MLSNPARTTRSSSQQSPTARRAFFPLPRQVALLVSIASNAAQMKSLEVGFVVLHDQRRLPGFAGQVAMRAEWHQFGAVGVD